MSNMKSTLEIAMEKADRLGKASPEELRRQQEEKLSLIAGTLAEKLLSGLDLSHWEMELGKYPVAERDSIIHKIIPFLVKAIDLEDYEKSRNSLAGISRLRKGEVEQGIQEQLERLFEEYGEAQAALKGELEEQAWEKLRQIGISGKAIKEIDPLADPEGRQGLKKLIPHFDERLNKLKQELLKQIR